MSTPTHDLGVGIAHAGSAARGCRAKEKRGTSLSDTNPMLDPQGLADNGGPTQTIALQAGSAAIDAGDPEVCAAPPVNGLDQRGYTRPGEGYAKCSIGAYEYGSSGPPTPTPTATPSPSPTQTPTATPQPGGGGGCTVTPNESGVAWWLLLPVLMLVWARRRERGRALAASRRTSGHTPRREAVRGAACATGACRGRLYLAAP